MAQIPRKAIARAVRLAKRGLGDLDNLIEALAAEYVKAQAELESKTALAFESGRLGERSYRARRIQEARRILNRVNRATRPKAKELIRESVRLGDRQVRKVGVFEDDSSFSRVNQIAIGLLLDSLTGRLEDATATVGRRVDDVYRSEGLRLAAVQLSDEGTMPKASESLVRRLQRRGITSFVDKAGRSWSLDAYARMAIKTTSSEAVFHGSRNQILARGFDLVEVNTVQNACPLCKPYEGKTFSLTGRTSKYPLLKITFPIHPHCRHFITMSPFALEERTAFQEAA